MTLGRDGTEGRYFIPKPLGSTSHPFLTGNYEAGFLLRQVPGIWRYKGKKRYMDEIQLAVLLM